MNQPAKILFIEDNELDREAFLRLVKARKLPWQVTIAETLAMARARLAESRFDVIIADNHLPDGESPELFPEISGIPFLLVTGTLEEQLALRTLERGADDFLVKDPESRHLDALPFAVEKTLYRKAIHENEKRLNRELRETQENFRRLVESVQEYAIYMLDPDGKVKTWNRGAQRTMGWPAEEIQGQHFSLFFPPEAVAAGDPVRELEIARRHGSFHEVSRRIRRDGSTFWADITLTPVADEEGKLMGFSKVMHDISEQHRAQEILRESEAALQLAANAANFGLWNWDLAADRLTFSDECKRLFGLPLDSGITYTRLLRTVCAKDRQAVDDAITQALDMRTTCNVEFGVDLPDGVVALRSIIGRGYYDSSGKALRIAGVAFDPEAVGRRRSKV